jgi:hypothetical protein
MKLDSVVDSWGSPLTMEEKKPAKSADRLILEDHAKAETVRIRAASASLDLLESRFDSFQSLIEGKERVKVKAVREHEDQGLIEFDVEIDAGDLSALEAHAEKEAKLEDPKNEMGTLEDYLENIFGSEFESKLNDAIWNAVRREGAYVAAEIELNDKPAAPGDFKRAKFKGTLKLHYESPALEYGSLEQVIASAIDGLV